MSMQFQLVKAAIVTILGDAAAGRYRTIGFQQQGQSAREIRDNDRSVQVFYSAGRFPKSGGSLNGPTSHHMTFKLELAVSKRAEADLTAINNPESTPEQLEAAIAAFLDAATLCDDSFDELVELIYLTLMNAENYDLGFEIADAPDNRWIDSIQKDPSLPRGEYCILTGAMMLTCKINEAVDGVTPTASESIETVLETYQDEDGDDDEAKAGVETDN